ncbi:hypothetical protein VOLCADRAFT_102941 [Volvox carteri f. nagariensis]|uniref:Uncharacterized protein n=1 Tax=Volvox carteri f. nagariensis TaxID=3068 RepID=D8TIX9_VOLCA|nr:uncharacterized protein VOLCADRAFT_102941 [Volvox carteri f. nagariensis]EFJ52276.1 hypothetical protein VOLCADRAFT_102941 [Volvox carteri f. nagariensis]|eukprot:XP_002946349.1 hypothetical protein VOLCADRAFT_102941 [Volvox carteri f. nagariensis]
MSFTVKPLWDDENDVQEFPFDGVYAGDVPQRKEHVQTVKRQPKRRGLWYACFAPPRADEPAPTGPSRSLPSRLRLTARQLEYRRTGSPEARHVPLSDIRDVQVKWIHAGGVRVSKVTISVESGKEPVVIRGLKNPEDLADAVKKLQQTVVEHPDAARHAHQGDGADAGEGDGQAAGGHDAPASPYKRMTPRALFADASGSPRSAVNGGCRSMTLLSAFARSPAQDFAGADSVAREIQLASPRDEDSSYGSFEEVSDSVETASSESGCGKPLAASALPAAKRPSTMGVHNALVQVAAPPRQASDSFVLPTNLMLPDMAQTRTSHHPSLPLGRSPDKSGAASELLKDAVQLDSPQPHAKDSVLEGDSVPVSVQGSPFLLQVYTLGGPPPAVPEDSVAYGGTLTPLSTQSSKSVAKRGRRMSPSSLAASRAAELLAATSHPVLHSAPEPRSGNDLPSGSAPGSPAASQEGPSNCSDTQAGLTEVSFASGVAAEAGRGPEDQVLELPLVAAGLDNSGSSVPGLPQQQQRHHEDSHRREQSSHERRITEGSSSEAATAGPNGRLDGCGSSFQSTSSGELGDGLVGTTPMGSPGAAGKAGGVGALTVPGRRVSGGPEKKSFKPVGTLGITAAAATLSAVMRSASPSQAGTGDADAGSSAAAATTVAAPLVLLGFTAAMLTAASVLTNTRAAGTLCPLDNPSTIGTLETQAQAAPLLVTRAGSVSATAATSGRATGSGDDSEDATMSGDRNSQSQLSDNSTKHDAQPALYASAWPDAADQQQQQQPVKNKTASVDAFCLPNVRGTAPLATGASPASASIPVPPDSNANRRQRARHLSESPVRVLYSVHASFTGPPPVSFQAQPEQWGPVVPVEATALPMQLTCESAAQTDAPLVECAVQTEVEVLGRVRAAGLSRDGSAAYHSSRSPSCDGGCSQRDSRSGSMVAAQPLAEVTVEQLLKPACPEASDTGAAPGTAADSEKSESSLAQADAQNWCMPSLGAGPSLLGGSGLAASSEQQARCNPPSTASSSTGASLSSSPGTAPVANASAAALGLCSSDLHSRPAAGVEHGVDNGAGPARHAEGTPRLGHDALDGLLDPEETLLAASGAGTSIGTPALARGSCTGALVAVNYDTASASEQLEISEVVEGHLRLLVQQEQRMEGVNLLVVDEGVRSLTHSSSVSQLSHSMSGASGSIPVSGSIGSGYYTRMPSIASSSETGPVDIGSPKVGTHSRWPSEVARISRQNSDNSAVGSGIDPSETAAADPVHDADPGQRVLPTDSMLPKEQPMLCSHSALLAAPGGVGSPSVRDMQEGSECKRLDANPVAAEPGSLLSVDNETADDAAWLLGPTAGRVGTIGPSSAAASAPDSPRIPLPPPLARSANVSRGGASSRRSTAEAAGGSDHAAHADGYSSRKSSSGSCGGHAAISQSFTRPPEASGWRQHCWSSRSAAYSDPLHTTRSIACSDGNQLATPLSYGACGSAIERSGTVHGPEVLAGITDSNSNNGENSGRSGRSSNSNAVAGPSWGPATASLAAIGVFRRSRGVAGRVDIVSGVAPPDPQAVNPAAALPCALGAASSQPTSVSPDRTAASLVTLGVFRRSHGATGWANVTSCAGSPGLQVGNSAAPFPGGFDATSLQKTPVCPAVTAAPLVPIGASRHSQGAAEKDSIAGYVGSPGPRTQSHPRPSPGAIGTATSQAAPVSPDPTAAALVAIGVLRHPAGKDGGVGHGVRSGPWTSSSPAPSSRDASGAASSQATATPVSPDLSDISSTAYAEGMYTYGSPRMRQASDRGHTGGGARTSRFAANVRDDLFHNPLYGALGKESSPGLDQVAQTRRNHDITRWGVLPLVPYSDGRLYGTMGGNGYGTSTCTSSPAHGSTAQPSARVDAATNVWRRWTRDEMASPYKNDGGDEVRGAASERGAALNEAWRSCVAEAAHRLLADRRRTDGSVSGSRARSLAFECDDAATAQPQPSKRARTQHQQPESPTSTMLSPSQHQQRAGQHLQEPGTSAPLQGLVSPLMVLNPAYVQSTGGSPPLTSSPPVTNRDAWATRADVAQREGPAGARVGLTEGSIAAPKIELAIVTPGHLDDGVDVGYGPADQRTSQHATPRNRDMIQLQESGWDSIQGSPSSNQAAHAAALLRHANDAVDVAREAVQRGDAQWLSRVAVTLQAVQSALDALREF